MNKNRINNNNSNSSSSNNNSKAKVSNNSSRKIKSNHRINSHRVSLGIRKISNRRKTTRARPRTSHKRSRNINPGRLLLLRREPTSNKVNSLHPRQENGKVKNRRARAKAKMKPPHHPQERVKGKIRHLPRLLENPRNLRVK